MLYGDYYKYDSDPLYRPLAIIFKMICIENNIVLINLIISNIECISDYGSKNGVNNAIRIALANTIISKNILKGKFSINFFTFTLIILDSEKR
jgi:hypothetical protein